MNAPANITPADKARAEARQLANDILAGETQPYGKGGIFTVKEWTDAAQYLIDTDDCDELLHMMAVEAAAEDGSSINAERWADEADYRYDLMREEQMLAQWEGQ